VRIRLHLRQRTSATLPLVWRHTGHRHVCGIFSFDTSTRFPAVLLALQHQHCGRWPSFSTEQVAQVQNPTRSAPFARISLQDPHRVAPGEFSRPQMHNHSPLRTPCRIVHVLMTKRYGRSQLEQCRQNMMFTF
jgi:hypothetical protein